MEVISFQWRLQTILIACAKKLQHVNFCGFVTRYNTFFNRKQLQKCFQIARSCRLVQFDDFRFTKTFFRKA